MKPLGPIGWLTLGLWGAIFPTMAACAGQYLIEKDALVAFADVIRIGFIQAATFSFVVATVGEVMVGRRHPGHFLSIVGFIAICLLLVSIGYWAVLGPTENDLDLRTFGVMAISQVVFGVIIIILAAFTRHAVQ